LVLPFGLRRPDVGLAQCGDGSDVTRCEFFGNCVDLGLLERFRRRDPTKGRLLPRWTDARPQ
jgi:hypothetical protein